MPTKNSFLKINHYNNDPSFCSRAFCLLAVEDEELSTSPSVSKYTKSILQVFSASALRVVLCNKNHA